MRTKLSVITQVVTCQGCELHKQCRTPVPMTMRSSPAHDAAADSLSPWSRTQSRSTDRFLVLGEAPGRIEDIRGKNFVGPAGRYLRANLQRVGLDPEDGIYMNVVCCWPHGQPNALHIASCRGNLYAQLDWASRQGSRLLVCGTVALSALLPHAAMRQVMGSWLPYPPFEGLYLFPVLHPSFVANRAGPESKESWKRLLEAFSSTREIAELMGGGSCVYCNRAREYKHVTCWRHRSLWKQDTTWKAGTVQGRLDL